jgi:hypothetical protein
MAETVCRHLPSGLHCRGAQDRLSPSALTETIPYICITCGEILPLPAVETCSCNRSPFTGLQLKEGGIIRMQPSRMYAPIVKAQLRTG